MAVSDRIVRAFHLDHPEPHANSYYAGYNCVLLQLFPPHPNTLGPLVCPRRFEPPPADDPTGSYGSYVVAEEGAPLLALEMRVPAKLASNAARAEADAHIRARIAEATPTGPLGTFHAVSAFGTRLCFYTGTLRDGAVHIEPPLSLEPDDPAPLAQWDCDVLEAEGMARFEAVAGEINALYPTPSDCEATFGLRSPWRSAARMIFGARVQWWMLPLLVLVLGVCAVFLRPNGMSVSAP